MSEKNVFQKIIDEELPAEKVHEDEMCVAFRDANPQAPTHILVVPRKEIVNLMDADSTDKELLGHLMLTAREVARQEGLEEDGFRLVVNNGEGVGQTVFHLHLHVLGGRSFSWPPG